MRPPMKLPRSAEPSLSALIVMAIVISVGATLLFGAIFHAVETLADNACFSTAVEDSRLWALENYRDSPRIIYQ